jgi:hypothetical protein
MHETMESSDTQRRLRVYVVNGVFVSAGMGDDGRIRPHGLFTALAQAIEAETGFRAQARWPYRLKPVFGIREFMTVRRRQIHDYATYLTECIDADLRDDPLAADESLAFVAYSGGTPIVQTAATLLRDRYPVSAFVFFGPALLPRLVPREWRGGATVGCILGERDWVQGVFPRLPRPWRPLLSDATRARIVAHLPPDTYYRTLACDHWPGYFSRAAWPDLVDAVVALLRPAAVPAPSPLTR